MSRSKSPVRDGNPASRLKIRASPSRTPARTVLPGRAGTYLDRSAGTPICSVCRRLANTSSPEGPSMESNEPVSRSVSDVLTDLVPVGPPHLAYLRRAPAGLGRDGGTLLCLSASFNPLTTAHAGLIREASRVFSPGEVLLLLAVANVDKAVTGLPLAARLDLLQRFSESRPIISVAAVGHGRFVDKMNAILPVLSGGHATGISAGFRYPGPAVRSEVLHPPGGRTLPALRGERMRGGQPRPGASGGDRRLPGSGRRRTLRAPYPRDPTLRRSRGGLGDRSPRPTGPG